MTATGSGRRGGVKRERAVDGVVGRISNPSSCEVQHQTDGLEIRPTLSSPRLAWRGLSRAPTRTPAPMLQTFSMSRRAVRSGVSGSPGRAAEPFLEKGNVMRKVLTAGLGLALLVACGTTTVGQEVRQKETTRTTVKFRKVTTIIGTEVRLKSGALGKVADIVVNEDGCLDYLIVRDEDEFVAIPWGAVSYETNAKVISVTSDVTRARLKAVRFRGTTWPDFYSEKWIRSAGEVWGERTLRRHDMRRDDTRRDKGKDDLRAKSKDR